NIILIFLFNGLRVFSQESLIEISIKTDTLYYNNDFNFKNHIAIELKNKSEDKYIIPIDFNSFNLLSEELKGYSNEDLISNQDFVYPWIKIQDIHQNNIFGISEFHRPGDKNPYFEYPILKNETFYSNAFKYAIVKLEPYESISFVVPLELPFIISENDFSTKLDLREKEEYDLWIEFYIFFRVYELYLNKEILNNYLKDGYKIFQGNLMTNKVKLLDFNLLKYEK